MAQGNVGTTFRWLTEQQVADLVDINDSIDALARGVVDEARGAALALDKMLGTWDGGAMHALGAMHIAGDRAGFKTWVHTGNGATAVYALFDSTNGRLVAMLEAATLGQIRTSAMSGLAARALARAEADEMAVIGTGAQAITQVAAVAAVRRLRRLRVFSRGPAKRADFVNRARELFEFEIVDCDRLEEAVSGAPIVTLITRASEPFLHADMVAPGALVIAAGAILPGSAECHPDLVARAGLVVVDSIGNARTNSRELREHFASNASGWDSVRTLGSILQDGPGMLPIDRDITLFKPMGTGLSDLAVAALASVRADERAVGLVIDQPQRAKPRWRTAGSRP